jgi:osmoprotectant transport system substrate-binding protein
VNRPVNRLGRARERAREKERTDMGLTRRVFARRLGGAGLSAAGAFLAACGAPAAGTQGGGAAGATKPTVRIGSANFPESTILGELYAQALESGQYKVERRFNLGSREIYAPALESGQIDFFPEYLATYTAFVAKDQSKASTDPAATLRNLNDVIKAKSLTALDYAPAVDTNGVVLTKATADQHKLAKTSDLAPLAAQMVIGGPPECPTRDFCLLGLEKTYGLKFKEFKPLDAGGPLTVAALEGNQIDVAILFTTDAAIQVKGFVLLQDDKKLQLADNVVPVVRDDLLAKAQGDFKALVNGVSAKLTTEELTALNKKVGVDRQPERTTAADWLKAKGLVK